MGPLEILSLPDLHEAEGGPEEENLRENHCHAQLLFFFCLGFPITLDGEELSSNLAAARDLITEETVRSRPASSSVRDPASTPSGINSLDLDALKRKFPFLLEYSDNFIRDTGVHILIKAETASRKLLDMDRNKKAEDKLFFNRESLSSSISNIAAGSDNRLDSLHAARCLPGATCSAGKLWLHARSVMGDRGHPALSTYDMGSIGLGGCVSAKGWVEIHDPASATLSIRMFSMGNCVSRGTRTASDDDFPEMSDLSEFKAAIRVLRGAMAFVHPWNRSVDALESFFIQSNFGQSDLAGATKPAAFLSQFTDYVLSENASRWRGMEAFVTTRDLRSTWADYISQKSGTLNANKKANNNSGKGQFNKGGNQGHNSGNHFSHPTQNQQHQGPAQQAGGPPQGGPPSVRLGLPVYRFYHGGCVMWNLGKCLKATGTCTSKSGSPLKHVCNHRPDMARTDVFCGKEHPAFQFHK